MGKNMIVEMVCLVPSAVDMFTVGIVCTENPIVINLEHSDFDITEVVAPESSKPVNEFSKIFTTP